MGNSPTPPGLIERIMQMVDERISRFANSGFLRNATISDGGLTIKGGFIRLVFGAWNLFYVGPITPAAPDGTVQQGVRIRRSDGTIALHTWDAFPGVDGTFNQALSWMDREGNIVFADDTDSGQGIARPYVPGVFYPSSTGDWPATTSPDWDDLYDGEMPKQHPRLRVAARIAADAGTTGELRLTVEDQQFGGVVSVSGGAGGFVQVGVFGPLPVAGEHMSTLHLKLEARRTGGTGLIKVSPIMCQGMQT